MHRRKSLFKTALACALSLPLLLILAAWVVRRLPPDPAVAQAMARLSEARVAPGENALAAALLLGFDIPADQIERERALVLTRLDAWGEAALKGEAPAIESLFVDLHERFRALDLKSLPKLECSRFGDACLAGYGQLSEADLQPLRKAHWLSERLDELRGFGHHRAPLRLFVNSQMPLDLMRNQAINADLLLAADDFRQGDRAGGLARVCRQHAATRRFVVEAEFLIPRAIDQYALRASARLLSQMLAELPLQFALPNACDPLRGPATAESTSMCLALGGEYRYMLGHFRSMVEQKTEAGGVFGAVRDAALFSDELYAQQLARMLGWACDEDVNHAMRMDDADFVERLDGPSAKQPTLQCYAAPGHCLLAAMGEPDLSRYALRSMDDIAASRSLSALLYLREQMAKGVPADKALAASPANLSTVHRPLRIEKGALVHDNFEPDRDPMFSLPLPGSNSSKPGAANTVESGGL